MATTPDLTRTNEVTLSALEKETAFLPELAARWPELPEIDRTSWELEWSELMAHLAEVDSAYRAGMMTVRQQERYADVLKRLQAVLPTLDVLDLERPSVWLEP